MVNWKRPENVPFPSVWLTFQAKDIDSDKMVNYRIQDLPEDRFTEAIDYMTNCFNVDEVLGVVKGVERAGHEFWSPHESVRRELPDRDGLDKCPESLDEVRKDWENTVKQNMSLVCFKEDSDELVGVNIIRAVHKNDKSALPKATIWREVFVAVKYVTQSVNIFEKFNTDVYMASSGLWVANKYRGKGIGQRILEARVPLGKAVSITCTSTLFTSIASQKTAARAGFEEVYSCSSEEFESHGMHFPDIKPVKLMTMNLS